MESSILSLNLPQKNQKQIVIFVFWSIAIFLSVYYFPRQIGILISFALAFYTYHTKSDIIPLMLFALIGLGMAGTFTINQLPRFSIVPGQALNTLDLMSIAIFLKIFPKGILRKSKFSLFFTIFFVYIIINFIITSIVYGPNLDIGLNFFRTFFYYVLYFYCIYAVKEMKDFNFIIKILVIFSIIIFGFQLLLFFAKIDIRSFLTSGSYGRVHTFVGTYGRYDAYKTEAVRAMMGDVLSPFLLFILSLSFLNITNDKKWKAIFYISIMLFCLSVFVSATRVWTVIISVTLLGFLRFSKNIKKGLQIGLITILVFIIIFLVFGGQSFSYVHDVLIRIGGLGKIATGKYYEIGTLVSRLNRLEEVKRVILQSPLIGFGFTEVTLSRRSSDFGFLNTILAFGIVGLLIIIYLLISYIKRCKFTLGRISRSNPFYKAIYVFLFAWLAIIVSYSFTWDFFTLRSAAVIFMSLFLGFTDFLLRETVKYELSAKQEGLL